MKRRRIFWLLGAFALFGIATWLMWRGEQGSKPVHAKHDEDEFPNRWNRRDDVQREQQRLSLPPPAVATADAAARPRDPMLVALSPTAKNNVVFEAAAIKDSPFGKMFIRCALQGGEMKKLDELKEKHGLDVMNDLDRVAFSDKTAIVGGRFDGVKWDDLFDGAQARSYGDRARIFETPEGDAGPQPAYASWGGSMMLMAPDAKSLEDTIDRLEGRAPPAAPPIAESEAYGEAYGVLGGEEIGKLLPGDLPEKVRQAAQRIELHVDTRDPHDVLMVADVTGQDTQGVADLGKSLGAAMAVARVKARADGDEDLVELLEVSHVLVEDGQFRSEIALPLDLIERNLCHRDGGS